MKIKVEAEVQLNEIVDSLISQLQSKQSETVELAAQEIADGQLGERVAELHRHLVEQYNWNWSPSIPASIDHARSDLVRAAHLILAAEHAAESTAGEDPVATRDTDPKTLTEPNATRIGMVESALDKLGDHFEFDEHGLLGLAGYRAGKTHGLPEHERRDCIASVMAADMNNTTATYRYGSPGSVRRKQYLLNLLRYWAKGGRQKEAKYGHDYSVAVGHWEDDISWINVTYD